MSWKVLQRWFNIEPWTNASYILDNQGDKFWIYWLDKSEIVANLRVWYRGKRVGYVNLIREDDNRLTLADIYIKGEYRHRGLGKGLMKLTFKWAREHGFSKIEGFMKNHDGLSEEYIEEWYRRQGFQVNGKKIILKLQQL